MPDSFQDALDRMEIGAEDITDFGTVRSLLQGRLQMEVSGLQIAVADEHFARLQGLANVIGATITTSRLREGRRMVQRIALRDARGRFIARGGASVTRFLKEEISF